MSEPWLERWQEGRIGWHESAGNSKLMQHWTATGRRVLVPLCGKAVDMLWLARQGNDVVGVELSELAAQAFFAENDVGHELAGGAYPVYRALDEPVEIHCCDFFEFSDAGFDALYDRGALIALPGGARPAYAKHIDSLLTVEPAHLLITVEYDDTVADGPPYSVRRDEVLEYWPRLRKVSSSDDIDNAPPKFRDAGLEEFMEIAWLG